MPVSNRSSLTSLISQETKESLLGTAKKRLITYIILLQLLLCLALEIIQSIVYYRNIVKMEFELGLSLNFYISIIKIWNELWLHMYVLDSIISKNLFQLHIYFVIAFINFFLTCFNAVALMMFLIRDPTTKSMSEITNSNTAIPIILISLEIIARSIMGMIITIFYFSIKSDLTWSMYRRMGANFFTFKLMKKRQLLWATLKATACLLITFLLFYYFLKACWQKNSSGNGYFFDLKSDILTHSLAFVAFLLIGFISLRKEILSSMIIFIILFSSSAVYLSYLIYIEIEYIINIRLSYKNSPIYINSILNIFLSQLLCIIFMILTNIYSFIAVNNFNLGLSNVNFYKRSNTITVPSIRSNTIGGQSSDTSVSLLESSTDLSQFLRNNQQLNN